MTQGSKNFRNRTILQPPVPPRSTAIFSLRHESYRAPIKSSFQSPPGNKHSRMGKHHATDELNCKILSPPKNLSRWEILYTINIDAKLIYMSKWRFIEYALM